MDRRHFLLAAGAAALARPAGAASALTVGYLMAPQFGAAYIAKDQGLFDKQGLDVKLQLIGLTSTMPAAIVSNSVQLGGMGTTVFLQAIDSGIDLVGIAAGSLQNAALNEVQLVAGAKSGIRSPAELAGRKIALPGLNGALHVMTVSWLKKHGVDPARVSFVEVPFPQMRTVLMGGNVDAVVTVEPFAGGMVAEGVGSILPGVSQSLKDGSATTLWVASRQWAEANASTVKAFRSALSEAVEFAKHDQAAARGVIGRYFKVPPAVLQALPFPPLQSDVAAPQLQHWVDLMLEQGMIKRAPHLASLILR